MKICMIGAGYVGLVSAACFADFGWNVTCVDKDEDRVARLKKGEIPIYEPGLDELVERNVAAGRMHFLSSLRDGVQGADVVFLAVGTPIRRGDGYADLSYVFEAVAELAPHIAPSTVITTKSTVPVGTSREIERRLKELRPDAEFAVCSNPEFLREGSAIRDFTHPDRVLVGCDSERGREVLERLYEPLALRKSPLVFVSRESAELAKYAANAFLAMKITFINEVADLCEMVGADVGEVATAIGADGRIGREIPACRSGLWRLLFPQGRHRADPHRARGEVAAFAGGAGRESEYRTQNRHGRPHRGGLERIGARQDHAVLGVTFKPNTDDMREAPSLVILPMLQARGASIRACDPQGRSKGEELMPGVAWFNSAIETVEGADALVVLTEWNEFRAVDLRHFRNKMRGNVLIDLRNVYQQALAEAAGFVYRGVGRGVSRHIANGASQRPRERYEAGRSSQVTAA